MKKRANTWKLLFLIAFGAAVWYVGLSDSKKRFLQNLLRQLPYLPARYAV
ncbi:MAG: hypothetical protein JXA42_00100 [Anaerolineales bacterium]|nr:hypothetical protein [Anaerolineales bacterium]